MSKELDEIEHLSECLYLDHPEYETCTCMDWYPEGS